MAAGGPGGRCQRSDEGGTHSTVFSMDVSPNTRGVLQLLSEVPSPAGVRRPLGNLPATGEFLGEDIVASVASSHKVRIGEGGLWGSIDCVSATRIALY